MIIPQGRAFRALNSALDYSIITTVKGGAVKVKRKVGFVLVGGGHQLPGKMLL
jgi:hypothetical protein